MPCGKTSTFGGESISPKEAFRFRCYRCHQVFRFTDRQPVFNERGLAFCVIEIAVGKEKHTKKESRYEPMATGKDYCGICRYYEPYPRHPGRLEKFESGKGTCKVVEGEVNFGGWSKYFKRKK